MPLPRKRARRIRSSEPLRGLLAEHRVSVRDLIEPLIVVPGHAVRNEISSMPGVWHQSVDQLVEDAKAAADLGIPAVLLFGLPERKDERASLLSDPAGPVQRAIASLKKALPELIVIADLCACEYTSHGHCGVLDDHGYVDNDRTLTLLAEGALSYARAGVDIIAPSDMMDGRVAALRHALDADGFSRTAILSYAVKYASAWYGPFREAVDSTPAFGDRRTHQMDPCNVREGLKEALQDVEEGADMLIVKPGMPYLDV
ncbi:MAG: porphobilinogen synthase, partial [Candidatus Eremiobacteraeota bacterium]|nr:porphobilinogen synthase [Candidatus Eremiobacteraeota bacterium]